MNTEQIKNTILAQIQGASENESITPTMISNILIDIVNLRYKTEFTLLGDIDGTNKTFLTETPYAQGSIKVYLDGLRLTRGEQYYEYGNKGVLFSSGTAVPIGSKIIVDYIPVDTVIIPDINVYALQFSDEFGSIEDSSPYPTTTTTTASPI